MAKSLYLSNAVSAALQLNGFAGVTLISVINAIKNKSQDNMFRDNLKTSYLNAKEKANVRLAGNTEETEKSSAQAAEYAEDKGAKLKIFDAIYVFKN